MYSHGEFERSSKCTLKFLSSCIFSLPNLKKVGFPLSVSLFPWNRGGLGNGTNVANLTDKDNIIGDSEQIQMTNIQASGAQRRSQGAPLASIFVS